MKAEILSLLRETGGYISGQELCGRFGVTRAAVWKVIKGLQQEGYGIEAVTGRGYRLVSQPDIFSEEELKSRMHTKWAGRELIFYEKTGSTNIQAKLLAEEGAPSGTLVVAEQQTQGRGRRGRTWASPAGRNLYFTLLLKPDFAPDKASMLTLVMALAVQGAVTELCGIEVGIKWPNDVVINGKKVTGILTEMSVQGEYIQHVVIGVGVNVKKQEFVPELEGRAASLEQESGRPVSRAALLEKIMEHFEADYALFIRKLNLSLLTDAYNAVLVNCGREVRVLDPAGEYTGQAEGINEKGELCVHTADGKLKKVYAGEVSVRGVYGYV
ncbi:MAG: biotin--[acetyl-CoA-carboxylase] ligase [Lachnospiraceae bacterium]|nr:biotin--[acetyl-CoA-carboxylase] ligase [Lachnospiraceae bacterium]